MAVTAYNTTLRTVTARLWHACDSCHLWHADRRGVCTIAPGHRYVIHVTFPGADGNDSGRVISHKECLRCMTDRIGWNDTEWIANPCGTFCCGDVPCVRPFSHVRPGDIEFRHSCHRCTTDPTLTPERKVLVTR